MKKVFVSLFVITVLACSLAFSSEPESIAPFDEKAYNEYLIKSLKDPNLGIRFSAAQLIGERKIYEAKDELVHMLKNDKQYQNRIAAAIALKEIADQDVLNVLVKQCDKDKNKTVKHVLAGITTELKDQRLLTVNN